MTALPRYKSAFTGAFENIGEVDEALKISWMDDQVPPQPGNLTLIVGTGVFLESPINTSQVPDDHLLASIRMSAILAGEILPGTAEYLAALGDQSTANFQTIIGNVKVKTITSVIDASVGPAGTVFDIEFQKVGAATNVKTIRTDAWALSQDNNGNLNFAFAANCIPGMLHKVFAFKKSDLGAAGSANRNSVIAQVASQKFWI